MKIVYDLLEANIDRTYPRTAFQEIQQARQQGLALLNHINQLSEGLSAVFEDHPELYSDLAWHFETIRNGVHTLNLIYNMAQLDGHNLQTLLDMKSALGTIPMGKLTPIAPPLAALKLSLGDLATSLNSIDDATYAQLQLIASRHHVAVAIRNGYAGQLEI